MRIALVIGGAAMLLSGCMAARIVTLPIKVAAKGVKAAAKTVEVIVP